MSEVDRVFSEFKEHSVAEFFKKNRQMLGFSGKTRSLTTIIHEYVTNSLDAAEEGKVLPEIKVSIKELEPERYFVRVEDNALGVPKKHVGKAFGVMLAGTKFHRYVQQRGQQGIGATGCTMYSQITTGKPVHVKSGYDKKIITCDISVDFKTNSAVVSNMAEEDQDGSQRGVVVEAEFADVKYDKSSYGVYEYLKRTAIANPHAKITLHDPFGETHVFPRAVESIPQKPHIVQPHPLGITVNDLLELAHVDRENMKISSFLQNALVRVSPAKVKELEQLCPTLDFSKKPPELSWGEAEILVGAFSKVKWIAPATDSVIPIGQQHVEKSLKNILNPDYMSVRERPPKIYRGGIPFIAEVAIAYGGQSGRKVADKWQPEILRYANRAPLLFDASGCGITEAIKSVDWNRYNVKNFDEQQLTILVNLSSVHVPYTGAGKQAISDDEEVVAEVKNAVMEVARDLQRYISGLRTDRDRAARKTAVLRYVKQFSADLSELAGKGKKDELEKKLIKLIEEKYASMLEESKEEIPQESGNGEGNGGDDGQEE
ncbi:DNA topoisomerase VI subunit B [Candidatus Parvarchaeota archaeon]|nr:DNA topoisomerase VI subunit B [Candidatus Parvarchaeota archaeon]